MTQDRRMNDMTVEELLVAYETESGDDREIYAIELDARGVLDGARPRTPVFHYSRWLLARGMDCQKADDPDYDLICGDRRTQVHGRMEDAPAAEPAKVRFDPGRRTFDAYALVVVRPGYTTADALLCPWDQLAPLVRAGADGEGEIAVAEFRRADAVDRLRLR